MRIVDFEQAVRTIEADVEAICLDQGLRKSDELYRALARAFLEVEEVPPDVAKAVRRFYLL